MYRIEMIKTLVAVFPFVGFWDVEGGTTFSKKWKLLLLFFFATAAVSFAVPAFTADDKDDAIFSLVTAIVGFVQAIRLSYIIRKRSEIVTFIHHVDSHTIQDQSEFKKVDDKLILFFKFMKYLMFSFIIITTLAFVFDATSPEKILPLNIAFPLDWKNSTTGYWVAFTYLAIQCSLSIFIFSFNFIIWYLMLVFSIEHELLGNQLRRLGSVSLTQKRKLSEAKKQNLFLQDFIAAVESHQNIRETINQFESCFSNLFFIQVATSSLGLCGSVYTLAFISHKNLLQALLYSLCLVYFTFDISTLMYLGNGIKLSSDRLSNCLFESNWMDQSHLCKKCIIIFAEILQRPHEVVVGYIYPLNLETFRRILNFAYNMFNILRNLN